MCYATLTSVAVKTARSKLGARLVEVEITSNEKTTILRSTSPAPT